MSSLNETGFSQNRESGRRLLTASGDNTAKLWDNQATLLTTLTHQEYVNSAVFSPDGSRLLTASADNTAKLWDGGHYAK